MATYEVALTLAADDAEALFTDREDVHVDIVLTHVLPALTMTTTRVEAPTP